MDGRRKARKHGWVIRKYKLRRLKRRRRAGKVLFYSGLAARVVGFLIARRARRAIAQLDEPGTEAAAADRATPSEPVEETIWTQMQEN